MADTLTVEGSGNVGMGKVVPPTLSFSLVNKSEPTLVMKEGKFIWKGQEVKDVHKIYERFNEWLTKAEQQYS